MFTEATKLNPGFSCKTRVCIIGGGIAGISIARSLNEKGIDNCILESGSFNSDLLTMDLNRGENAGLPYTFADGCRSRFLGGSSNCWGGWCTPMDKFDFEVRDWVNNSGWPIGLDDLLPYYEKAHELLQLGSFNYDPHYWEELMNRRDIRRMNFTSDKVRDMVAQLSPPTRFGKLYRDEMRLSERITVFLKANVMKIQTDETGQHISHVDAATFNGNHFPVFADYFILATGGIENARLLLVSDSIQQKGLGNDYDLVGRYFMDHPRLLTGNIQFTGGWQKNKLYDMKYNYHNRFVSARNVGIAGQLALTEKTQKAEKLLNARVCFLSVFPGEMNKNVPALLRYKKAILKKETEGLRPVSDLISIITNPLPVGNYILTRFIRHRMLIAATKIQIITEQEPDFNNRITLSEKKDKLGMRRVKVTWRPGNKEKKTIDSTLRIIGEQLTQSKIAEKIDTGETLENKEWPAALEGTWHHMGTTRMHASPRNGVTDANCKLHGVSNLFVAGSSVFPTSGPNFPTITLTALALRLAQHIAELAQHK